MDNRKDALRSVKMCRFCLTEDTKLSNLYDRSRVPKNAVTLPLQILACVSIEVFPSDGMPTQICDRCRFFMDISYHFKQICRQAEESIMQFLENGEPLEPVTWPSKLLKLFPSNTESVGGKEVVKTLVTESGTCVQVQTDSEEDGITDEKVYNIKIESDGSQSLKKGSSFRVITGDEKIQLVNNDIPTKEKSYSTGPKLARHVRTHSRGSEYPCKFCSKVFYKSHHYTRHLRLKHKDSGRAPRNTVNDSNIYRCDQCEEAFSTQDDLIYHSAYHATQNLICPLCQDKFEDVDAVTTHIKSHVDSEQYMCDLCELVFTSQERLDIHVATKHEDELREEQLQESDDQKIEEDSMDMEPDEEGDEDQDFSLKEEGDHMVVEIKKPNEFAVTNVVQVPDGKSNKISEGNENEMTYTELATVDTLAIAKQQQQQAVKAKQSVNTKLKHVTNKQVVTASPVVVKSVANAPNQATLIVQKAEEIKRKSLEQKEMRSQLSNKELKSEKKESTSSSTGTSDKSLRLLEKELRELQRTSNARNESGKSTPTAESMRGRRLQIHTSTPKLRNIESKKILVSGKTVEKRSLERIPVVAKENKECKENRDSKNNNANFKEEKEPKEQKFKEQKVKNGIEKAASEESARRPSRDDSVRRSSRPSKIRDYAKMIREGTQVSDNDDDDYESEDDDEEYGEDAESEVHQPRGRLRRTPAKPAVVPAKPADGAPANAPRKRGRPRKIDKKRPPSPEITKTKKLKQESEHDVEDGNNKSQHQVKKTEQKDQSSENDSAAIIGQKVISDKNTAEEKSPPSTPTSGTTGEDNKGSPMLLSPSGQTLKKIPVKSLPPGIKPLPLPANARPVGQLCEMQIGEKVMKVQKIVMTKEKVEQLAKQGLIEVKAGTMVLKTGYKLASSGDSPVKGAPSTPDNNKESTVKRDKPTPTRCDLQEES